jgi:hypothetical protein
MSMPGGIYRGAALPIRVKLQTPDIAPDRPRNKLGQQTVGVRTLCFPKKAWQSALHDSWATANPSLPMEAQAKATTGHDPAATNGARLSPITRRVCPKKNGGRHSQCGSPQKRRWFLGDIVRGVSVGSMLRQSIDSHFQSLATKTMTLAAR